MEGGQGNTNLSKSSNVNSTNAQPEAHVGNPLSILYTNCDVLTSDKTIELLGLVKDLEPDIITLTEVKPKYQERGYKPEVLTIEGYAHAFHNLDEAGRGILTLCKDGLRAQQNSSSSSYGFNEAVKLEITTETTKLSLVTIYRSPNSSEQNAIALNQMVDNLANRSKNLVLIGDFNYPTIKWQGDNESGVRKLDKQFNGMIEDNLLVQHVNRPTRFRHGQNPSLVDLVISSDESLIETIDYLQPLGKSDHVVLAVKIKCEVQHAQPLEGTRYLLNNGNYDGLREELKQIDWDVALKNKDTNEAWDTLKDILSTAADRHIPKTRIGSRRKVKRAPYLNQVAINKIRSKRKAWKRYLANRTDANHRLYVMERNDLRTMTRKQKGDFEEQLAREVKTNPKAFWGYVKRMGTAKHGTPDLVDDDGKTCSTDLEKANALNKQFTSVYTREPLDNLPNIARTVTTETMHDISINAEDIRKKIEALDSSKSAGPDDLHARVLKETAAEIATPLEYIFNRSLDSGEIPRDWKMAHVVPIYKNKGIKNDPSNYRPISLTSITCKIMESFIREGVLSYMKETGQLASQQHGFLPGKSCATNLIESVEAITAFLDKKTPVDIIYIDFSKAFDRVPHERLLIKMKSYGISLQVLKWVKGFLKDRNMRVRVGQSMSEPGAVLSGIPQGSVLGPTLFVIYVNDLPQVISSLSNMLADDLKMIRGITNIREAESYFMWNCVAYGWSGNTPPN